MRWVTRLVGLWILTGAYMKLFYGTPADLPAVARQSPLSLSLTFKLVIATELVVGMLALLRPSFGWWPALLLLLAFIGVVGFQVVQGETSCGCFGTAVTIMPSTMLAIDVALLLLFVVSQPWRRQKNRLQIPGLLALVFAAPLIGMPWFLDREAKVGDASSGGWVVLEAGEMVGKPLKASAFGAALPQEAHVENGLVVIYRDSCDVCAEHLSELAQMLQMLGSERAIVLLRLPEDPDEPGEKKVGTKPEGPTVRDLDLPDTIEYACTPPVHIEIQDGVVREALEGMDVIDAKNK